VLFYLLPTGYRNLFASCIGLMDNWFGSQVLLLLRSLFTMVPVMGKGTVARTVSFAFLISLFFSLFFIR
jgi:hypothetical protein